ncbi:MAG: hypothetical protein CMC76_11965 [Flavobacteriaceae bacterium]|nr:hypothetical protein [Flavobacteriaceae bacterium]|tara:strand:- start:3963 stop:4847 length:885 start_codon:yes stop_codon:yes gene_type:complete
MKNLILIFAFIFCYNVNAQLIEIEPDSIVDTSDIVEKGLHEVYLDSVLISSHSKYTKAALKASLLRKKYPNVKTVIKSPDSEPTGSLRIFINENKLVTDSNLTNRISSLETQNLIQAEAIGKLLIADTIKAKKLKVLEARINTIQTFIRDSVAFTCNCEEQIDYSLPIIRNFAFDTTGWQIDTENNVYTYQDEITNRYISFHFNRDLEVGKTYRISFNIATEGTAVMDFWLYETYGTTLPNEWVSGLITSELTFENGNHYFDYTVELLPRERLGIRAKNKGDVFIITNLKIEEL